MPVSAPAFPFSFYYIDSLIPTLGTLTNHRLKMSNQEVKLLMSKLLLLLAFHLFPVHNKWSAQPFDSLALLSLSAGSCAVLGFVDCLNGLAFLIN